MKSRIAIAALAAIAVSACDNSANADPALEAAASQAAAASAPPVPDTAPQAVPELAKGAAPTKEFMVGTWAETGECKAEPIEFKADGSMVGPFERWELADGVLTMVGNPSKIKLVVVDQKTMESRITEKSEPRTLTRCQ